MRHGHAEFEADAVVSEAPLHDGRASASSRGSRCGAASRIVTRLPNRANACCHFAADRAAAYHEQAGGQLRQPEERLVCEKPGIGEARNRQVRRPAARGDDRAPESQRLPVDLHAPRAREAPMAEEHVYAERAEAPGRIVMADAGPQSAHPGHDGREVGVDRTGAHAERGGLPRLGDRARGPQQGLRRHAARVQAVAAEQALLDERHAGPEAGGARGADEPGSPAAYHHEVVDPASGRVHPTCRVHLGQQLPVRLVQGLTSIESIDW